MASKKELNRLLDHVGSLIDERDRLGETDANVVWIREILRLIEYMVEHEIQTYPKVQKNSVEEAVKKRTPQQRGKKGARRVLRRKNQGDMR